MKLHFHNIPLLLCLLFYIYPASAQDSLTAVKPITAESFKGLYEFSFSGLPFGRLGIEMSQTPHHYALTTDVALTGLLAVFVQHSSHTTVAARGRDIVYETHYHTRKKARYVKLDYKNGLLAAEQLIPPEGPGKRPSIPMELKKDAADPLSFIVRMREAMHSALVANQPNFVLKVFDGRRLSEVNFALQGRQTITIGDKKYNTFRVAITRKPLGGFNAEEMQNWQDGEPVLYAYFSDDGRLIPIRFEARKFGVLSATLVHECGDGESCLLGNKD